MPPFSWLKPQCLVMAEFLFLAALPFIPTGTFWPRILAVLSFKSPSLYLHATSSNQLLEVPIWIPSILAMTQFSTSTFEPVLSFSTIIFNLLEFWSLWSPITFQWNCPAIFPRRILHVAVSLVETSPCIENCFLNTFNKFHLSQALGTLAAAVDF